MNWIQTFTGRKVDPVNIRAEDICIEDIAHALALKCRYSGHCPEFYSVAQHSVHVAQLVPPGMKMWGLLHDAHEAYLADLAGPVKLSLRQLGITVWDELEDKIDRAIVVWRGLPSPCPAEVKTADKIMLVTEARAFFGETATYRELWGGKDDGLSPVMPAIVGPWNWQTAERNFLAAYKQLEACN